jgi:mono/diheme cytochrome c family protein
MRYFFLSFFFAVVLVVSFAGTRGHRFEQTPWQIFPDMKVQAKVKYQVPSDFFADGHAMRKPVAGTVPMGFSVPDKAVSSGATVPQPSDFTHGGSYYFTGKMGDFYGDGFPPEVTVDAAFIKRGQERYNIHCAICHGQSGNGKGIFTKYSPTLPLDFTAPNSDDPANALYRPDGKLYDAITNGSVSGIMGPYGANINVQDRWAIVAYIRAIQFAAKNPAK